MTWRSVRLGEVLPFKYGKGLPQRRRNSFGTVPVVSSGGITGAHDEALVEYPCVVIGRKGTIGSVYYMAEPCWPIDTVFYSGGTDEICLRFAYYFLQLLPLNQMNNDSAVPGLNRSQAEALEINIPDKREQQAIAATLGALDDKIESNLQIVQRINSLQETIWNRASQDSEKLNFLDYFSPHLGGTPARKNEDNWTGEVPWVSVKDMTSAECQMILKTAEGISKSISKSSKRFTALPTGSVFLTARGTVGKIVTNLVPCAINQSAYGFVSKGERSAAHRFMINEAVEILKNRAHGSTFDAITVKDFEGIQITDPDSKSIQAIENGMNILETLRRGKIVENNVLRELRDALLPELMSGRIRVREAQEAIKEVTNNQSDFDKFAAKAWEARDYHDDTE